MRVFDEFNIQWRFTMGNFYRNPQTQQERREYFRAIEQGVKPRGKRSYHNLPTEYDDFIRKDLKYKNWKYFRRNQTRSLVKNNEIEKWLSIA